MSTDDEWFGEPHTLTVHEVTPEGGPLDDGSLGDYDLEHPPSCTKKVYTYEFVTYSSENPTVEEWDCGIAEHEAESGLAWTLKYSGTPITEPGTYRIQAWGRKCWTELGWEYDGGVGLMDEELTS